MMGGTKRKTEKKLIPVGTFFLKQLLYLYYLCQVDPAVPIVQPNANPMRSPLQYIGFVAALAICLSRPVQAQEYGWLAGFNPRFEIFTLPGEDGSNNVQCIVQDRTGFLWFASMKGLHRFDGQHVLTYRHDPKDPFSIAADYIEWICPGHDGILWLGHSENGVSAFDPRTENASGTAGKRRIPTNN